MFGTIATLLLHLGRRSSIRALGCQNLLYYSPMACHVAMRCLIERQLSSACACSSTPASLPSAQLSVHRKQARRSALLKTNPSQLLQCSAVTFNQLNQAQCLTRTAALAGASASSSDLSAASGQTSSDAVAEDVYSLESTKKLVETAMLAAVSGLAYVVSTILKLDSTLGYFLPLPIVIAALRSGPSAGWQTMSATGFLLVVLLGPIRALSYVLMHGLMAATMGATWRLKWNYWLCICVCAGMRMLGQYLYLVMSSFTMNENLFALLLSNVFTMLDQVAAQLGMQGTPSTLAVVCMMVSLLLVNALTYCFLLHAIYRAILGQMKFDLVALPGIVQKYLYAGQPQPQR